MTAMLGAGAAANGQRSIQISSSLQPETASALPDSPGFTLFPQGEISVADESAAEPLQRHRNPGTLPPGKEAVASVTHKLILPGQVAPKLTNQDKVWLGLIHGVSPFSVAGWIFAAGYEQVTDNTPNYGTDSGAYGQRLAAAAVRGYTEEVLSTSVLSTLLHEDPRYYRMGPRRPIAVRVLYAVTRPIVTRADDGHLVPNFAQIGGNLAGAALTNAYYPSVNRGFGQTMDTFEGSMAGAAFSAGLNEFLGQALEALHLRHFHE